MTASRPAQAAGLPRVGDLFDGCEYPDVNWDNVRLYHGTHARLLPGDRIEVGYPAHDHLWNAAQGNAPLDSVFFTRSLKGAHSYAEHAARDRRKNGDAQAVPRVYRVRPTARFEHDPREPRDPEYSTRGPLLIEAEVTNPERFSGEFRAGATASRREFLHGSRHHWEPGDVIDPSLPHEVTWGELSDPAKVYLETRMGPAAEWAQQSGHDGPPAVYQVRALGPVRRDARSSHPDFAEELKTAYETGKPVQVVKRIPVDDPFKEEYSYHRGRPSRRPGRLAPGAPAAGRRRR